MISEHCTLLFDLYLYVKTVIISDLSQYLIVTITDYHCIKEKQANVNTMLNSANPLKYSHYVP